MVFPCTRRMISTTIDTNEDKLGAMSPDALENTQTVYAKQYEGVQALAG